jgi:hypothetical protein
LLLLLLFFFFFCFFFWYVIITVQQFSCSRSLTSVWYLLYSCSSMTIKSLMSPFQGQGSRLFYGQSRCQRNPYFFSRCYQINSKLVVKVAYGLHSADYILGADQLWPS